MLTSLMGCSDTCHRVVGLMKSRLLAHTVGAGGPCGSALERRASPLQENGARGEQCEVGANSGNSAGPLHGTRMMMAGKQEGRCDVRRRERADERGTTVGNVATA